MCKSGETLLGKIGAVDSGVFSFAGGVLSFLAIGLPWWTAVSSAGEVTVSLLIFGFPPGQPMAYHWLLAGIQNGLEIDYTMLFPSIVIGLPFMTMAGLLGAVGFRQRMVRPVAGGLAGGALMVFLIGLSRAIMPFGWYGNGPASNGCITWGLSVGFYVAVFGFMFLLLSSIWSH
jgi:hypothetical protein